MDATLQLTLFDYNALDAETRIVVQQRTSEIKSLMKRAAQDIIEIGQKLIEVKERLGHGNFGKWLETEFAWSYPTANRFMNVAANLGQIYHGDNFDAKALYLLAAPSTPEPARMEALTRAEAGETITHSLAKEIVAEHRQPAPPLNIPIPPEIHPLEHELYRTWYEAVQADPTDLVPEPEKIETPAGLPLAAANHYQAADYDGDEWYTPAEYIEAARLLMDGIITLDPATCATAQKIVKAEHYYTKDEDDGLLQGWFGNVWLNPPYSTKLVQDFTAKAIQEYEAGNIAQAVILVNNCTDTGWFHNLLGRYPACYTRGRIAFWRNDREVFATRQGQVFFYLGRNVSKFVEVFSQFGIVVNRMEVIG